MTRQPPPTLTHRPFQSNAGPGIQGSRRARVAHASLLCAAGLGLQACISHEPLPPLAFEPPPAFSQDGQTPPADRWWTSFGDERLDQRVETALAGNYSLAAAWERISEAGALARAERSALFPQVDASAFAEAREGRRIDQETSVGLGLEASYEVDLWGRIRSAAEAQRLRAEATASDYQAAAISLSASLTLTWFQLAEAGQQLKLIDSQLATNQTVLRLLEQRFAVGQSGSADVLRQRQLIEATREQAIVASSRVQVLAHQLAVLEGRPPQAAPAPEGVELPEPPPLPAAGLPAALVERRPDVRSALLRVRASDADLASAISNQYPRIDLAAAISTTAEGPSGLFTDWLASLAAQIVAPVFDGGRRRADAEAAAAVRGQRVAEYGQTVLLAFQEVEDSLTLESHQARRILSLEDQLAISETTYQQLRSQYFNGAADYIDVLTALRETQQLERDLLAARLDRIASRVALYRALAGGFDTPREASERGRADEHEPGPGEPSR